MCNLGNQLHKSRRNVQLFSLVAQMCNLGNHLHKSQRNVQLVSLVAQMRILVSRFLIKSAIHIETGRYYIFL